jgi:NADPH2:quinone reductase
MISRTMQAAGFQTTGAGSKAESLVAPAPAKKSGEMLVAVKFSVINPADLLVKSGAAKPMFADAQPPYWGGLEFAGIVESAGADDLFPEGTRVAGVSHFAGTGQGAHAEFVAVPITSVCEVPEGMPLEVAACVPMSGLTAMLAIDRMGAKAGDTIAVVGAAGSVGAFAVQIAAKRGIRTIAIVSEGDAGIARSFGATDIVVRGANWVDDVKALAPGGVKALLDTALVGDATLPAIADGGIMIALRGSHLPADPPRSIKTVLISVREYYERTDKLSELLEMVAAGPSPRIAETFPAVNANEAFTAAENTSVKGRVVLAF